MKTLKTFLFNRFNIIFSVVTLIALSFLLLTIRLKLTESFFYLFLTWNLFLAIVPYLISSYLTAVKGSSKGKVFIGVILWILFLPNAPYIITDLIHLRLSPASWLGFDAIMIGTFIITGLFLYFLSLKDIHYLLSSYFNKKITNFIILTASFLSGFGVYLGRFLRWNSWDILHNPQNLLIDVFGIIFNPFGNMAAWIFTILFGLLLNLGYWSFNKIYIKIKC